MLKLQWIHVLIPIPTAPRTGFLIHICNRTAKEEFLFTQRLPLTEKLAELLHRNVELVPEHEFNHHIRDQVLREAVEL